MGIYTLKGEAERVGSWNASWNFREFSSVPSCEHGPIGGGGRRGKT